MSKGSAPELKDFFAAISKSKAEGVVGLDVRGLCSVADFLVICTGRSNRQVMAIGEQVVTYLKKQGRKAFGVEGLEDGRWVLLDYGDVVVHVFYEDVRTFYDLEGLWADAKVLYPGQKGGFTE